MLDATGKIVPSDFGGHSVRNGANGDGGDSCVVGANCVEHDERGAAEEEFGPRQLENIVGQMLAEMFGREPGAVCKPVIIVARPILVIDADVVENGLTDGVELRSDAGPTAGPRRSTRS